MRRTSPHGYYLPYILTFLLGFAGPAGAGPLLNGAFTSFDGWSAQIRDSLTDADSQVNPAADPRFSLVGGGFAALGNDVDYYEVALFQDFDLLPSVTTLVFDYSWFLTAGDLQFPDFIQATLFLLDSFEFIDLFPSSLDTSAARASGTAVTDVSAFAGKSVSIEFLIQDGDFDERDVLEIGNIAVAEAPLPPPAALMALGLVPLIGRSVLVSSLPRRAERGQGGRRGSAE
jgi:hypothetical protein